VTDDRKSLKEKVRLTRERPLETRDLVLEKRREGNPYRVVRKKGLGKEISQDDPERKTERWQEGPFLGGEAPATLWRVLGTWIACGKEEGEKRTGGEKITRKKKKGRPRKRREPPLNAE